MDILSDYLTEPELLEELAKRGFKRSKRWAQIRADAGAEFVPSACCA